MTTHPRNRLFALACTSITLLFLSGCAGVSTQDNAGAQHRISGSFPVPNEIEGNVALWTNVYGRWSRGQVAFHDDRHMGVVYEVLDIPEWANGSDARDWVSGRQAELGARLGSLESKVGTGEDLTADERELRDKIVAGAGPQAVFGARERLRSQRGMREKFRRGLEISGRYDGAFREIFRGEGLPEDLAYLPHVESSFQTNARSSVGAAGVWQFMPATGRLYMKVGNGVDERLDPVTAAGGAASYLRNAYERLGSWPLAVTSYNHGVGGMQNARNQFGDDFGQIVQNYRGPAFGFSSRNFYASFLAAREVAGHPHKYFPEGVAFEPPLPAERILLDQSTHAHQIARQYDVDVGTLSELNLAWLGPVRSGQTPVPAGTSVWIPKGATAREVPRYQPEPSIAVAMVDESPPTVSYPSTPRRVEKASEPVRPSKPLVVAKVEPAPARIEPSPTVVKASQGVALTKAEAQAAANSGKKLAVATAAPPPLPPAAKGGKVTTPVVAEKSPVKGGKASAQAKAEPAAKNGKALVLAKAEPSTPTKGKPAAKPETPAAAPKSTPAPPAKASSAPPKGPKSAAELKPKLHVVQPNETFYRVADLYDLTVDELKRINGINSKETNLRPGQRLRVSI